MFQSTLSVAAPDLARVSVFLRQLNESHPRVQGHAAHLAALPPSLAGDLKRFDRNGIQTELIEVVAAAMRHGRALLIQVEYGRRVLPLTIYPDRRLVHAPLPLRKLLKLRLTDFFVLRVAPALTKAPSLDDPAISAEERALYAPLGVLAWELAMRGARAELLPEIPVHAAFRIPPGVSIRGIEPSGTIAAALHRLKREATNLKEMSGWAGFDRERAMRLLNGLYLQSALMATRTHPAASSDVWA
jgi:hypothetical protein